MYLILYDTAHDTNMLVTIEQALLFSDMGLFEDIDQYCESLYAFANSYGDVNPKDIEYLTVEDLTKSFTNIVNKMQQIEMERLKEQIL